MKEYNIGDKVWWAHCGVREESIPCIVCFGKLSVTLILGDDTEVETPCRYCTRGYEGPFGYTKEYVEFSDVKEITITRKEVREDKNGRKIEYRHENYCLCAKENIFDTKEEAEKAVKEMIAESEKQKIQQRLAKKKSTQSDYTWAVGYHKKRLKEATNAVKYHSSKIKELKSAKENIK